MKNNPLQRLRERLHGLRIKPGSNVVVFLFFLFLATLFWYLNALSKVVEARMDYPVRFVNLPGGKVLVEELPEEITLRVEGPGYQLIKRKLSAGKSPVSINLQESGYLKQKDPGGNSFYILTSTLTGTVSRQLRADFRIMGLSPDTLFFHFDELVQKRVPVIPAITVEPGRQYMVTGPVLCSPDTILASGPGTIVDTLRQVFTAEELFSGVENPVEQAISLQEVPGISLSRQSVLVNVAVEQFTEARLNVPLQILNEPDTVYLRLFPDEIALQCLVPLSDYPKLSPDLFVAHVKFPETAGEETKRLQVKLNKQPHFVRGVQFYPLTVEYLIEK